MWESEDIPDPDRVFMRVHKNHMPGGELIPGVFPRKKSATNWECLKPDSDKGIDYSNIPQLGSAFWRKATLRMPKNISRSIIAVFASVAGFLSCAQPTHVSPDQIMQAAGYDTASCTSSPLKWKQLGTRRPRYVTRYAFKYGPLVTLELDAESLQTVHILGTLSRGPNPTSDTANLTEAWARAKLNALNVHRVPQGAVYLGTPTIVYDPGDAQYEISFPRTDLYGRPFEANGVSFWFDHGASRVTVLSAHLDWPEPAVTTGTVVSVEPARANALAALNARKNLLFRLVPDKRQFFPKEDPVRTLVVMKTNLWDPGLTSLEDEIDLGETAVVYAIPFRSVMTDPSYQGEYDLFSIVVCVDVFSGQPVGADWTRVFV